MRPSSEDIESDVGTNARAALSERGLWVLVVFVLLAYFARMDTLTLRHEEPRRGRIATEMLRSGDFVVPRQQGELHLSRPPLQNWMFAGLASVRGRMDAFAIRLPSALAILATVFLLYLYARRFLGPLGAFAGGAAYVSMGQVLELGTKGETEALFSLFVAGSLLVWHAGASRGTLTARTWMLAYVFVALGTLTKAPQAPTYFGAGVGLYMLLRGRWRELIAPAHFAGLLVYALLFGLWLVPFYQRTGLDGVRSIFVQDVGYRFEDRSTLAFLENLATYPLEVLGSMLPWSVLLFAYLSARFRRGLGRFRDPAFFALICIAVSFPTCWLPPGSKTRYYMALYPVFALLAGAVVERAARAEPGGWRKLWTGFQRFFGVLAGVAGLAVVGVRVFAGEGAPTHQPAAVVALVAALSLLAAAVLLRSSAASGERAARRSVLALTAWCGLMFTGYLTNVWRDNSLDAAGQVAALRTQLPEGVRLHSIGVVDPVFAHYWDDDIELTPWSPAVDSVPDEVEYFAFSPRFAGGPLESLRFEHELLELVATDFNRHEEPRRPTYVGRVVR